MNKEKSTLAWIELNLLPSGEIEVLGLTFKPSIVEDILDENEDYQGGYMIRKIMEQFNECYYIINEKIEDTIKHG